MSEIRLIQYDDNVAYEEGHEIVLAVRSKERAESIVKELAEWLKKTESELTKAHYSENGWGERSERRESEIEALKPPYGIEALRNNFKYDYEGSISTYAVPLIE